MTAPDRRYPITTGCRVMHINGREGVVQWLDDGDALVLWDDNKSEYCLHGYLQALPGPKVTA